MLYLILGLVVFFGAHLFTTFRSREPGKDLKAKLGYGPYMGLYSLVSLAGFVLICWGFAATRDAGILYVAPSWGRHVNMALMLPALILLVASQLPTGAIKKAVKHPMLVAVKLWAFGHLLANGEINSVILFTSFLAYAVIDRIAVKRRGDTGPAGDAPSSTVADIGAVVIGTAAYVAILMWLHPILFGVAVM
ncbi:NnrU family protein [Hyphomonas johnsonii]|jgi:uncharacterized membrane protein|uniref:NnrU family protein n=1 Tax=Hyphomonas johnsonii MHS-2 TaxID=1280950 RepID=A0A059FAP4_9PROT|nr:NnrU family protein [Hyphomonas johnsonii]KCZ87621.1 NnrU family protein [Hyphomonas johnsonii MHS-2]